MKEKKEEEERGQGVEPIDRDICQARLFYSPSLPLLHQGLGIEPS